MVRRGAAVRLTPEEIQEWKGPVWYVSHLVAPNPHSVTTPVRLVWNSSQAFKGVSMNDLLLKGPDVLNPIRAVLLQFPTGEHAALGDITKMYNSVWLKNREIHLHRFLWRDDPEEDIGEYAITRVNIGDRPAGCIAQLAMRETAGLPQFIEREEERRVLEKDSYVDDILTSHDDLEMLDTITSGVEEILSAGGFSLKPWVRSGQGGRRKDDAGTCGGERPEATPKTLVLPNQLKDEDNKALGIGYLVDSDQLYVMTSVNFSKRKGRMRTGLNLKIEEVRKNTPKGLSRRELLSQVAALYDPIGLVSPAKQKGNILVRRAFQEAGGGSSAKETWDDPISPGLREEAIKLFGEYVRLGEIKFHRSLTLSGQRGRPWGITFSDGSDHAYGAVLYVRWETQQGIRVRLVESKAKLAPLDQKGDAVRAEVCGVVYATRLRKYVERHSRLQIEHWIHLVDSRTVLGAIQRESYGYQSFSANRIGEIQKAGSPTEWWSIPGECNVADIITRGAAPEELSEDSPWQKGPGFLEKPFEEWPVKSAAEVAADARESVNKLKRKAFSGALTRAQANVRTGKVKLNQSLTEPACESGIPKESVLTTYMRFTALRGHPSRLWSDPGTNFVGARPALEELYSYLSKVDKVKLEEEAASHGTEWSWKFHPADSPHRNGAAEAAVKVVKRALRAIDKKGPFTLVELQTLLYLAANLANERPIEARIQAQEDDVIEYLSPNSILLGRTGPKGDSGGFKWDYPFQRFHAVQGAVSEFWRRWSQLAGPNLFTRPKWHTRERNVAVGDLVWLADQNALRCQYRLGRVVQAVADSAGVVRDVRVRTVPACPASPGKAQTREKKGSGKLPGVVLHRDVRRIVVVLPIEEQGTFVASLDK
ncbi:hypothetical protein AAFF_G00320230 [Aldrovandia affinis]|uniref:DUF5641 domain-containing protein n=1 Tax=Aldrovandia affinis TaxID=143900 RepID=A0AAD7R7Q0_9TELE|nr:hypothetical protein AAFF_G00320230 [Aldrovandia affinis]